MRKYIFIFINLFFLLQANAQTFYVVTNLETPISNNYNQTFQLNIDNCNDSAKLYTCIPTNANDTNYDYVYTDIAIDTAKNLYYLSEQGSLYTRKLNDSTSCQFLGVFDSSIVNSLATDVNGNVFAAGFNYDDIPMLYEYQPKTKTFRSLGALPSGFFSSGDLFFYEGRLFLTVANSTSTFLAEITIANPSQSCLYMDLAVTSPYAAFSIQNGTCSGAYIIGNEYNSATQTYSSTLYQLDLSAKTISSPICTYPYQIQGAASLYNYTPSIIDSNSCTAVDSNCTTMPIHLLNFSYTLVNKTVTLQWQTAIEINSNYFLIQRSADGTNFSSIGKQPAANNSSTLKQYIFTDNNPLNTNYYRLKEVDLNGNSTYSNTLLVKLTQAQNLTILQNPVQNSLQVQLNNGNAQTSSLTIFDLLGRRFKSLTVPNGLQTINVSSLPSGTYIIQLITSDGEICNERFIKAK